MGQAGRWILVLLIALAAGIGAYWLVRGSGTEPEAATAPAAAAPPASAPTAIPERRPE